MHVQLTDENSKSETANVHAPMGKVLPEGEMPPSGTQYQSTLADRMSFASSQGSSAYHPLDTSGDVGGPTDPKRKKGTGIEGKSIEEELCRICGDRASGYHYNALSCEGCKGFFRRSITKTASYICKYGGNCEMDMWMRRKCQSCRLRRCREVGMKEECLLSEDQCKARDARRKAKQKYIPKKEVQSPDSYEHSSDVDSAIMLEPHIDTKPNFLLSSSASTSSGPGSPNSVTDECNDPMKRLNQEQRDRIETLVALQDKYEFADKQSYDEILKDFDARKNDSLDPQTFLSSMASTFILITHLIVEFAKGLPGFLTLSKDDQITLLKSSSTEVMSIRAARCYDLDSRAIVFGNGQPCTVENMKAAGQGHYSDLLYEFCHNMATYKTDNAEYALFTAVCIFSERPGLEAAPKVEKIQTKYVEMLQAYEIAKRGRGGSAALARFLSRLTDLRTISVEHSKVLVELDLKKNGPDVPSIIKDILTLPPEGN